jgi:F-type H+-transporting ATPase subunit b
MLFSLVAAAETTESPARLLLPEQAELIAGIVAFLIVYVFVWRRAAPAIKRSMEARQAAIGGQIQEAEAAKAEAQTLLSDYKAQLAEVRSKQDAIVEEARKDAEALRADILAKAQTEADAILTKAREEAAAEKARVLTDARSEVANLSIDLAERVVGESLDRETQLCLVERYIAELEK